MGPWNDIALEEYEFKAAYGLKLQGKLSWKFEANMWHFQLSKVWIQYRGPTKNIENQYCTSLFYDTFVIHVFIIKGMHSAKYATVKKKSK